MIIGITLWIIYIIIHITCAYYHAKQHIFLIAYIFIKIIIITSLCGVSQAVYQSQQYKLPTMDTLFILILEHLRITSFILLQVCEIITNIYIYNCRKNDIININHNKLLD